MTTIPARPHGPLLLVDTDTFIDLDPWEPLAKDKQWDEFFTHIPEAKMRDNGILDLVEFAHSEGAKIVYTSRWGAQYRSVVWAWLDEHKMPFADLYLRKNNVHHAITVRTTHAALASSKAKNRRPVLCVEHFDTLAAHLRDRKVRVVLDSELPESVKGMRELLRTAAMLPEKMRRSDYPAPRPPRDENAPTTSV